MDSMNIGDTIRNFRLQKGMSQGDIEKRTGLLRCYISRVENGHTVPAIETLEKMARAMEVPLYHLFYDGNEPPKAPELRKLTEEDMKLWGATGKEAQTLRKFAKVLSRTSERDRQILLSIAQRMALPPRAKA